MTAHEVVEWAKKYLDNKPTGASQMGGGLMNEVWRIDGEPRAVLKIYRDQSSKNPSVELTTDRGRFEAAALRLFESDDDIKAIGHPDVFVPRLLYWNPAGTYLAMTHLEHETDLGVALKHGTAGEAHMIRLATWLAGIHRQTRHRVELLRRFKNDSVQRTRLRIQYATIEDVLQEAEIEIEPALLREAGRRALALGRTLLEPGDCLIMGDLWPRSVLVRGKNLGVVDWEFSHYGRPLQDVAHFVAHLWLLADTTEDATAKVRLNQARAAFVDAYFRAADDRFEGDELENANVHAGSEIVMRTYGAFADPKLYRDEGAKAAAASRGIDAILGEWSPLAP